MAKKITVVIAYSLLVLFALSMLITLFTIIVIGKGIDYEKDEMLFSSKYCDSSPIYYSYNENGDLEEYFTDTQSNFTKWYSFDEIGDYLKLGFISAEDRRFYSHSGVNFGRTVLAFINQLFHFKRRFGASTITQQVVKNISGDNQVTIKRKAAEILRAFHIEYSHSKDEIFEMYLNIVPFTGRINGVGAAAKYYFNKSPCDLSLAESALIVGITNSPSKYDPIKNPEEAFKKRNNVLYAMYDNGAISKEEYILSKNEEISLCLSNEANTVTPWFVETANSDIINDLMIKYDIAEKSARLMLRGSKIVLTIDTKVQKIMDDYFSCEDNLSDKFKSGLDYSMVVLSNETGDLIGIIGSAGEKKADRILNFATANIIPGSTIKPLALYAPAIDQGLINSATLLMDMPIYYRETEEGIVGYPKNSPDVYSGSITVCDAVAYSKNTSAAYLLDRLGIDTVRDTLTKYGFELTKNDKFISPLALGQLESGVSLRTLSSSYSVFPSLGIKRACRSYIMVVDKNGENILFNNQKEQRIMKKETASIMTSLLEGVVEYGTAKSISLKEKISTAGKTGTSGGDKDRLFVGFTPYYTAGIWTGYRDRSSSVGNNDPSHLRIWDDVMSLIHTREDIGISKDFSYEDLMEISFSSIDGNIWCYECEENPEFKRVGYFSMDNKPEEYCDMHGRTEYYIPAYIEVYMQNKRKR